MASDNACKSSSTVHSAALVGYSTQQTTQAYEKGRPSYARECVDAMLSVSGLSKSRSTPVHVLDVGCGTGIFFRELYGRLSSLSSPISPHVRLTGVEPVPAMVAQFRETTAAKFPNMVWGQDRDRDQDQDQDPATDKQDHKQDDSGIVCDIRQTDAEHLPFADHSVDAIFAAQAFHWFGTPAALAEFHRVLVPGGTIALIWNTRDETQAWTAALEEIISPLYQRDSTPHQKTLAWQQAFTTFDADHTKLSPLQHSEWKRIMIQTGDMDMILARVMSISVIAALPDSEQDEIRQRVITLMKTHPETRDLTIYDLPYRTDVYWCTKL